ncbi:MAG: hypothetical protein J5486_02695 [Bacteroidaceae bacterium]|nr:hypothetical protein [Bacteroidaceae bacterium]
MIKIHYDFFYHIYEYLYLFVMVIYMGQMTPDLGRMVGKLSGNPIPLLIPIIMTVILLMRNPISFGNNRLWQLTSIMLIWSVGVCYKFHDFTSSNLSFYLFLIYAIFIAYIHIRVYGRDIFPIYEHIIVVLSVISLCLWGAGMLFPELDSYFRQFPETASGNNVLYLFHWTDPAKSQVLNDFLVRNQGCSWEPGRFSIMLLPAILINLSREGITFRGNKKIIILLLALVSTFSTTGYSIAILIYFIYWFDRINVRSVLTFFFIALPLSVFVFSLDFMGEKIEKRANFEGLTRERMQGIKYNAREHGDEYLGSIDRFESAYFEWVNFQQEPLLGYGRNVDHSWFRQNISKNFFLTGGLVKILSQYGIFMGALLYLILFYSSIRISKTCWNQQRFAFVIILLLSSISYPIFCIPVFTSFWLYGLFGYDEDEVNEEDIEYLETEDIYGVEEK